MKIVDVTEFYSERGGVRGHLDLKGQILRQAGHHHVIVAPGPENRTHELAGARESHCPPNAETGSARVIRLAGPTLPYDSNYHLLWRVGRVRRIVEREKPDVLEINSPYLAPFVLRRPFRATSRIQTFWWHADFIESYARAFVDRYVRSGAAERVVRPLWSIVRRISESCDATFAAGLHQANNLTAHGVPRVRHLPFGVDKSVFTSDARSAAWRAEILKGVEKVPIVVAMGRLAIEKHWPVVLEGFLRASERRRFVLLVFGDGPERQSLMAMVRGRSDVRFMGFEPDPRRLATALASSDVFVHGCPTETFGLGVAQAMASGLPLVVPDRGGAAELAHPSFSEFFRSGDGEDCGGAMARIFARDPQRLRRESIAHGDRVPGAKDQVEKTVEAYGELIAARRAGCN